MGVESILNLFSKVCIKPQKRGVTSILGFFHENGIALFYYSEYMWLLLIDLGFHKLLLSVQTQ